MKPFFAKHYLGFAGIDALKKIQVHIAPGLMMIYHDKLITSTESNEYNHPQKPTDSALCAILTPQRRPCRKFHELLLCREPGYTVGETSKSSFVKARLQHFKPRQLLRFWRTKHLRSNACIIIRILKGGGG